MTRPRALLIYSETNAMKWITSTLFTISATCFTRCTYLAYDINGTTLVLSAALTAATLLASYLAMENVK